VAASSRPPYLLFKLHSKNEAWVVPSADHGWSALPVVVGKES